MHSVRLRLGLEANHILGLVGGQSVRHAQVLLPVVRPDVRHSDGNLRQTIARKRLSSSFSSRPLARSSRLLDFASGPEAKQTGLHSLEPVLQA